MDDFFSFVSEKINNGVRVVVASVLETDGSVPRGQGTKMAIPETGEVWGSVGGGCVEKYIVREAKFVLKDGKTRVEEFDLGDDSWSGIGMSCGGKVKMMLELVEPPERLIIFGSGSISVGCAQIGNILGYKVIVLDPFATKEAFPGAEVHSQAVLQKIREMTITPFDNVLILTEHRYDIEALQAVVNSRARFIGMIGSKNRVNSSYKELVKAGVPEDKLLAVYAPVGLDIGAVSPQEISVSIMAEIINQRRGGSLGHLKLTKLLEKPELTHQRKEMFPVGEAK
ncbi:MAG TPA: XdhC family protein [Nitrososphaerales archaeon]|nr:XdhC family protein [Nitrososphaerales archaeon]